jgi:hypothetical protein
VTRAAQAHVRILREIDPQLDDPAFVRNLYRADAIPEKPKLKWHYRHLDLGLLDEAASFWGVYSKGPN